MARTAANREFLAGKAAELLRGAGAREVPGDATAEKIFATHFGGEPWVRTESPAESIDPRISARLGELGL